MVKSSKDMKDFIRLYIYICSTEYLQVDRNNKFLNFSDYMKLEFQCVLT